MVYKIGKLYKTTENTKLWHSVKENIEIGIIPTDNIFILLSKEENGSMNVLYKNIVGRIYTLFHKIKEVK